ncbi:MAG TPA: hypothetical protein VMW76_10355 [Bacteroidales bacterium]|nr:hypothetical protein [Bacteroidales bacterium]
MNNKIKILKNIVVTALIAAIIGFTSCEKYIWDPPRYEPPDTTGGFDTIFYSLELAPLFPQYNCTACHPGVHSPDLRVNNSYGSLTTGGYIDMDNPPQSKVVEKMEDSGHGETFSAAHVTLFIDWIYQGALDN